MTTEEKEKLNEIADLISASIVDSYKKRCAPYLVNYYALEAVHKIGFMYIRRIDSQKVCITVLNPMGFIDDKALWDSTVNIIKDNTGNTLMIEKWNPEYDYFTLKKDMLEINKRMVNNLLLR
jgi:hypothetical protein